MNGTAEPLKDPVADALQRWLQQRRQQLRDLRARVAKAKAEGGKEPFDFQAFARLYDVRMDYGNQPVGQEEIDRYEQEYYLHLREAKTVADFARQKEQARQGDAG